MSCCHRVSVKVELLIVYLYIHGFYKELYSQCNDYLTHLSLMPDRLLKVEVCRPINYLTEDRTCSFFGFERYFRLATPSLLDPA